MIIVADENMPAVAELFSPYGEVRCVPGRTLSANDVVDAQVLLVRSVTQVDAELLDGSDVGFVGSATIGTDHIDADYLSSRRIPFAHAPGCNADAVVDYVLATLFHLETGNWFGKTVAIVGCGNVGSRLHNRLTTLGVKCLCYDPFLTPATQPDLCEWGSLREADILCLHTPLTTEGAHPTWHLFDDEALNSLAPGTLLINAGRGGVIDNQALRPLLRTGHLRAALDVWEREPDIDRSLLAHVAQGTPHIAGYSLEGRLRGTVMVYQAFLRWQGLSAQSNLLEPLLASHTTGSHPLDIACPSGGDEYERLKAVVLAAYDPEHDFQRLRQLADTSRSLGEGFDLLRKNYPLRREFSFHRVRGVADRRVAEKLQALGFQTSAEAIEGVSGIDE